MNTIDKIHEAVREYYKGQWTGTPQYLLMSREMRMWLEQDLPPFVSLGGNRGERKPEKFQGMTIAIVEYAKPDFLEVV